MLSWAIDAYDPNVTSGLAVLEGIDGAWERAHRGREQGAANETVALDDDV